MRLFRGCSEAVAVSPLAEANAASQTEGCELFPKGLSARGRMEREPRTERGRAIHRQRGGS